MIIELEEDRQRHAMAQRADLPPDLVVQLAGDVNVYVRHAIAERPHLPLDIARVVRLYAFLRRNRLAYTQSPT
jgi:hypothetical protein